jgi:hypothetical protein
MRRVFKWRIHAIARCNDCGFEDENYNSALKSGRRHAIKTGHKLTIETGYCQIYNDRKIGK